MANEMNKWVDKESRQLPALLLANGAEELHKLSRVSSNSIPGRLGRQRLQAKTCNYVPLLHR